jgi:hypothetical protein
MTRSVIFPELLSGRHDDELGEAWRVLEGSTMRGSASCNLSERVLEVPLSRDATARVIRAHELMHARVSPLARNARSALLVAHPRALECAEEFRVNVLLARLKFDVALLRDGTEKFGGRRLAESGNWSEAVCFFMAVAGTGDEKDFLSGIRSAQSSWAAPLRAIRKRAFAIVDSLATDELGSTVVGDDDLLIGYAKSTLVLAQLVSQTMVARVPATTEEMRMFRRSLQPGARRPPTGRFANVKFDDSLHYVGSSRSTSSRRARAATSGTVLRYPGRLVTDSQRRAFGYNARARGGIVVIDQSGSMDLDAEKLAKLIRRSPDALIVGYSHRPGDVGQTANAWLLANRGSTASHLPTGNVGNGVDAPVLRWALKQRRNDEVVVWVTDGQVTDSNDHPDEQLTLECAYLVRRHRIRMTTCLDEANRQLISRAHYRTTTYARFGRVGRKLLEMKQN